MVVNEECPVGLIEELPSDISHVTGVCGVQNNKVKSFWKSSELSAKATIPSVSIKRYLSGRGSLFTILTDLPWPDQKGMEGDLGGYTISIGILVGREDYSAHYPG
jgi:hypothetical protein